MASLSADLYKLGEKLFGNLSPAIGLLSPRLAEGVSWAFAVVSMIIIAVAIARFIRRRTDVKRDEAVEEETEK